MPAIPASDRLPKTPSPYNQSPFNHPLRPAFLTSDLANGPANGLTNSRTHLTADVVDADGEADKYG